MDKPFRIDRIMWALLMVLESMLGIRFILALLNADLGGRFGNLFNNVTGAIIEPYRALFGTPQISGNGFKLVTLAAMGVYALMFWIVINMSGSMAARWEPDSHTAEREGK